MRIRQTGLGVRQSDPNPSQHKNRINTWQRRMLQHPTRIFKFKYALLIVLCMEPKQNLAAAKKNKGRSELPVPPIKTISREIPDRYACSNFTTPWTGKICIWANQQSLPLYRNRMLGGYNVKIAVIVWIAYCLIAYVHYCNYTQQRQRGIKNGREKSEKGPKRHCGTLESLTRQSGVLFVESRNAAGFVEDMVNLHKRRSRKWFKCDRFTSTDEQPVQVLVSTLGLLAWRIQTTNKVASCLTR